MFTKLIRVLRNAFLLVLSPLFWWGPVVHPHINRLALKKAEEELAAGSRDINRDMVERLRRNEEAFIFAGNSADAISTHHVLNSVSIYDYAHNALPDTFSGSPEFGCTLIDEWLQAAAGKRGGLHYKEEDFAVACGWLAHQLADWYPHYAAVDGDGNLVNDGHAAADEVNIFSGFADSHRVFGADFHPEILQNYVVADHALIELFHDLLTMQSDKEFFDRNRVKLFETPPGTQQNLLTAASERYAGCAARIPPEHIPVLEETFNTVIRGLQLFIELLTVVRPSVATAVKNSIGPQVTGRPDYLRLSVEKVVDGLFKKSYAEISRLARQEPAVKGPTGRGILLSTVKTPGSILFPIVRELGTVFQLNRLLPVLRGRESWPVRLKVFGLPVVTIDLANELLRMLISLISVKSMQALSRRNYETNALLAYLSELISDDHGDLQAPLRRFKRSLRPVVRIDGDPGTPEEERLRDMLARREIRIRIVPATSPSHPDPAKLLNPQRLLFRIDGYDVRDCPDAFRLEERWEDNVLLLACSILREPAEGLHHLFVDIWDNTNVHSRYLDREVATARR
ncbi:MAG TPA: hypothetical protein EYP63_03250 [Desulfotomaculum sp.]|nr:hypothetical protein [Desulfotomaculum sp.]